MSLPTEQQVLKLFQETAQQQYTMQKLLRYFAVTAEERPAFCDAIQALVVRGRLIVYTARAMPCRSVWTPWLA